MTDSTLRVQADKNVIVVSANGHFLTAFPTGTLWPEGYVEAVNATASAREFPQLIESAIWDTSQPASAFLHNLLRGRRAKVVERADGSVKVSRFATRDDLGTYQTTIHKLSTRETLVERPSLVEIVGAEERAFYLDPALARSKLSYERLDNPTLWSQHEALEDAQLTVRESREAADGVEVTLNAPDPAVELEDEFTVDSVDYIVTSMEASLKVTPQGDPNFDTRIQARKKVSAGNTGVYGSSHYDDGYVWGKGE
jgi:hypothetical protein